MFALQDLAWKPPSGLFTGAGGTAAVYSPEAAPLPPERRHATDRETYMGAVVHELRAPVAVIRSSAETLRRGVRQPRVRSQFLKAIENQTIRMARLVDRLLDSSHGQKAAATPRSVLLAGAVRETVSAFAPMARRRGISIKTDVAPGLAVRADPSDLSHVLGNLLNNAVKFNRRCGRIRILGRAEAGEAIVSVRDTGAGVPSEDLSRVFERFYRSPRTRHIEGTGLGLAIVRGIVDANRGRVWAENPQEGGAVFHVVLPLAGPEAV